MQRKWIGRSEGADQFLDNDGLERDLNITVYTTRPDKIFGAVWKTTLKWPLERVISRGLSSRRKRRESLVVVMKEILLMATVFQFGFVIMFFGKLRDRSNNGCICT